MRLILNELCIKTACELGAIGLALYALAMVLP